MRDNYVQELSRLRASNDDKKVELSKLRMEVSEGPSVSRYIPGWSYTNKGGNPITVFHTESWFLRSQGRGHDAQGMGK